MNYEEILQTVRGFCAREKLLDGKKHLALATYDATAEYACA